MSQKEKTIEELIGIIEELREKCPWDKKQTINSLRHLTIEEVYELSDAIIAEDNNNIDVYYYGHFCFCTEKFRCNRRMV